MTAASSAKNLRLLQSLCRANQAMLQQKIGLLESLVTLHGSLRASRLFQSPSDIVGNATIGQHYRHSLDHIEHAVQAAKSVKEDDSTEHAHHSTTTSSSSRSNHHHPTGTSSASTYHLSYDRRQRGGIDESDMMAAQERIQRVYQTLDSLLLVQQNSNSNNSNNTISSWLTETPVMAEFMLSGDSSQEYPLPSTVARELGFGVHHAIHHMAMVRVLVLQEQWLTKEQLDPNFGRAPSTIQYDRSHGSTRTTAEESITT